MKNFSFALLLIPFMLMGCAGSSKPSNVQDQQEVEQEDMPRLMLVYSTDTKGNTGFAGFILSTQDGKEAYLYDDEANYDDSAYSVYLALMLGQSLYQWAYYENNAPSLSHDDICKYAMLMEKMPLSQEDRNKNGISEDIYEIMARCYYNHKDVEFYAPTRQYGSIKYPYEYNSFGYENSIEICRVTDQTRKSIGTTLSLDAYPNGATFVKKSSRYAN